MIAIDNYIKEDFYEDYASIYRPRPALLNILDRPLLSLLMQARALINHKYILTLKINNMKQRNAYSASVNILKNISLGFMCSHNK